jgi:hypothetical protein
VGRTGDEVGTVGTVELILWVEVGGIEDDTVLREGKSIPEGVEVDAGTSEGSALGPLCRRCSKRTESEIEYAPDADAALGRNSGNGPTTKCIERERVK